MDGLVHDSNTMDGPVHDSNAMDGPPTRLGAAVLAPPALFHAHAELGAVGTRLVPGCALGEVGGPEPGEPCRAQDPQQKSCQAQGRWAAVGAGVTNRVIDPQAAQNRAPPIGASTSATDHELSAHSIEWMRRKAEISLNERRRPALEQNVVPEDGGAMDAKAQSSWNETRVQGSPKYPAQLLGMGFHRQTRHGTFNRKHGGKRESSGKSTQGPARCYIQRFEGKNIKGNAATFFSTVVLINTWHRTRADCGGGGSGRADCRSRSLPPCSAEEQRALTVFCLLSSLARHAETSSLLME